MMYLPSKSPGWLRAVQIGVGILAVVISAIVLISPLFFGATLAGIIIGIGLLITGIQMVFAGIRGRYGETPSL